VRLFKYCKKCNIKTSHRFVKNKTNGYYSCSVCLENNSKRYRKQHWLKYLAQKANSRKKDGSEILSEEILTKIYEKQNKCCALSGMAFDMSEELYRPSLDRIDSNKPYTTDNIQLVLFIVNKMKRELKESEFMSICYNISQNYQYNIKPYLFKGNLHE